MLSVLVRTPANSTDILVCDSFSPDSCCVCLLNGRLCSRNWSNSTCVCCGAGVAGGMGGATAAATAAAPHESGAAASFIL